MGQFPERRWRGRDPRKAAQSRPSAMFAFLRALVILMFGVLLVQLINLQVINGQEYKQEAESNTIREVPIPAARGLIFDRNGKPLVQNTDRFSAAILPSDLPESGAMGVYRAISRIINVSPQDIQKAVQAGIDRQGQDSPAVIKADIDRDTALVLMEMEPHAPGLQLLVQPSRDYLTGSLLSHVLGYVGPISADEYKDLKPKGYLMQDFLGKSGVELTYEQQLRGKLGQKVIRADALGREIKVISERPPVDGSNVYLTLDAGLQQKTAEVLQQYAAGSPDAAAVVMNVKTGEVLSMVSLPGFDGNVFSGNVTDQQLAGLVNSAGKPLVNHAIADRFGPGGTFKMVVGSAALQEGVATPATMITSQGYITVRNETDPNVVYVYPDWAALGKMDFARGLAMSSNVYYYYLAGGKPEEGFKGLGVDRVAKYARAFGFGAETGVDLPGESGGLVPDAQWKAQQLKESWILGDTYDLGIGQGYLAATPLQVLTATCAVANRGSLVTPHVVKDLRDSQGNVLDSIDPMARGTVQVSDANLQIVRAALRQSVTDGVAKDAAVAGVDVAGDAGTADYGPRLPNGKHATHGWFTGFAPYNDPQIAVVVFIDNGNGTKDAAPAAAKILDYYFHSPLAAQMSKPAASPEPKR